MQMPKQVKTVPKSFQISSTANKGTNKTTKKVPMNPETATMTRKRILLHRSSSWDMCFLQEDIKLAIPGSYRKDFFHRTSSWVMCFQEDPLLLRLWDLVQSLPGRFIDLLLDGLKEYTSSFCGVLSADKK
mmetsp:Transcript_20506/g.56598  ORF Transcript_20506/g.56598 Transcript_20506/m.56598 type:complete len:130 (+) Transcript_20506:184-573(+)